MVLLKVDRTLWDRELDDGVLESCCSGVVRGPSMLTVKKRGSKVSNMRTADVFIAMQGTLDIP